MPPPVSLAFAVYHGRALGRGAGCVGLACANARPLDAAGACAARRHQSGHASPWRAAAVAAADATEPIHSLQNPRVRAARALLRRRQRDRASRLLVEGHRLVLDAVDAGLDPEHLFYTTEALERGALGEQLRALVKRMSHRHWQQQQQQQLQFAPAGPPAVLVSTAVMDSISDTVTPQGVVAVLPRPTVRFPSRPTLVLVCDGVQDPGNLGTLLRAAAGAGVDGAILTSGCTDAWSLKALRSGMGAQLRLPLQTEACWDNLAPLLVQNYGCSICIADGNAEGAEVASSRPMDGGPTTTTATTRPLPPAAVPYSQFDWTRPCALVIGSEAEGPSYEARAHCTGRVSIPMANGIESLNAAVAGAILLFEASRQRSEAI
jgi:RNA methyltransferase, TrmH family